MDSERQIDIERLRARREQRQRELVRRRLLASAGLLAVALLAVVAVLIASSGGGARLAHRGASDGHASDVRNGSSGGTTSSRAATGGDSHAVAGRTSGAAGPPERGVHVWGVPILMYHVINTPPAGAPFPGLYVPASEFEEQMRALASAGFHAVTMDEMLASWRNGTLLPGRQPIVVSFDNGYSTQYTTALPVLRRLGWAGVENLQLTGLPPSQGGLSQAQVRGLIAAGWELDTQGFSHADLITLGPSALRYQVASAREAIRRRYHVAANWFCYPSGHYDATVVAAVREAGYVGSTTVVPGWAQADSDLYRLARIRVLGGTSGRALLALIAAVREDTPPPSSYGSG